MSRMREAYQAFEVPFTAASNTTAEFIVDDGLAAAAEVALFLGQPLLLAGDPGVGKTRFATFLADHLQIFKHETLNVSTTTEGRRLLYDFDEVARFRDAQRAAIGRNLNEESRSDENTVEGTSAALEKPLIAIEKPLPQYVRFTALGRAILWAAGPDAEVSFSPSLSIDEIVADPKTADRIKQSTDGRVRLVDIFPNEFRFSREEGLADVHITTRTASLVLLDEFDKAPRTAPNDLLAALENMAFQIDELEMPIKAVKTQANGASKERTWPVVIITSNSEHSMPDAFMRRCIFHWIEFPNSETLQRIIAQFCEQQSPTGSQDSDQTQSESGAAGWLGSPFVKSADALVRNIRDVDPRKSPATGELLAFVSHMLRKGFTPNDKLELNDPSLWEYFGALLKTREDFENVLPNRTKAR